MAKKQGRKNKVQKFRENDDNEVDVRIEFPNLTKEQTQHLFNAEKELRLAGIYFDTGFLFSEKRRDWEFDWSLKGARVKVYSIHFYRMKEKRVRAVNKKGEVIG
jgi:hypothetical protein